MDSWKKMSHDCRKISDVEEEKVIMMREMLDFGRGLGRRPSWELGTIMGEAGLDWETQGNQWAEKERSGLKHEQTHGEKRNRSRSA